MGSRPLWAGRQRGPGPGPRLWGSSPRPQVLLRVTGSSLPRNSSDFRLPCALAREVCVPGGVGRVCHPTKEEAAKVTTRQLVLVVGIYPGSPWPCPWGAFLVPAWFPQAAALFPQPGPFRRHSAPSCQAQCCQGSISKAGRVRWLRAGAPGSPQRVGGTPCSAQGTKKKKKDRQSRRGVREALSSDAKGLLGGLVQSGSCHHLGTHCVEKACPNGALPKAAPGEALRAAPSRKEGRAFCTQDPSLGQGTPGGAGS